MTMTRYSNKRPVGRLLSRLALGSETVIEITYRRREIRDWFSFCCLCSNTNFRKSLQINGLSSSVSLSTHHHCCTHITLQQPFTQPPLQLLQTRAMVTMVPPRRSRRIRTQSEGNSEDESGASSVASASSTSRTSNASAQQPARRSTRARSESNASAASSTSTPTRRSSRVARAGAGGKKNVLDVIPEVIVAEEMMDVAEEEPVKPSDKKRGKKGKAAAVAAAEKEDVEMEDAELTETKRSKSPKAKKSSEKVVDVAPSSSKSTPTKAQAKTPVASPATKSSKKNKKDQSTEKKLPKEAPVDTGASSSVKDFASSSKSNKKKTPKKATPPTAGENDDDSQVTAKTSNSPKKQSNKKRSPSVDQDAKDKDGVQLETHVDVGKSSKKRHSEKKKKRESSVIKEQCVVKEDEVAVPTPTKKRRKNSQSIKEEPTTESCTTDISPPKHVIDVHVHRMRFLKLHPKSIVAMAASPLESTAGIVGSGGQQRLAISRQGGAVELVNPHERWVSVGHVSGVREREVDALVWVCGKTSSGNESSDGGADGASLSLGYHDRALQVRQMDERQRLFGCSRDGTIFELDFARQRHKGVIGSGGGGVFCMASMCCRGKCCGTGGSCGGYFAAGCEDGTVKIYRASYIGTASGGKAGVPELVATLPSAGNAILSVAWIPGLSDGGMGGSVIFAGVADGTIRRFDCSTSVAIGPISTGAILISGGGASLSYRWKATLRMTVESRGLRESTKVWALQALSDGTVISGDSLGHVQIWDGISGTMTQTFDQSEYSGDILCLAVSEDENRIFASGVDSRVMCIQRQGLPADMTDGNSSKGLVLESSPLRKWINICAHRKHTHDVRALAICHKNVSSSKSLELLVSGGVDTKVCTYIAKDFRSSRPRIWFNWSSLSPVSISKKQRLLAVTRNNRIDLYRLDDSTVMDRGILDHEEKDESKCLVKTIAIDSPFNLNCSVISNDGKFLAASDSASLYVFSLDVEDDSGVVDVRPSKLQLSKGCRRPCTSLRFDETDRLICATVDGPINVLRLASASYDESAPYTVSLDHIFKEHIEGVKMSSYHFPVVNLEVSSDGKWLAAGRFSCGKGAVHVFTLPTTKKEQYRHWWVASETEAPTTCIKFLGGGAVDSSLTVGCSDNSFYIFNLSRRALSDWSRDMGLPILKALPKELTSRSEPVARIVANPSSPYKFILVSVQFAGIVASFQFV